MTSDPEQQVSNNNNNNIPGKERVYKNDKQMVYWTKLKFGLISFSVEKIMRVVLGKSKREPT